MRFIFGMIVGAALTVGGAYVRDTTAATGDPALGAKPMVNWDVVGATARSFAVAVRDGWDKLTSK